MIFEMKTLLNRSQKYSKELISIKERQKKFDTLWELYEKSKDIKYIKELKALYDI